MCGIVHLHVHSQHSLLDGFSSPESLAKRAKEMSMPAMALTDHGTMSGVIEFHDACKKHGVKPIIGIETYLTLAGRPMGGKDKVFDKDSHHLLLLAKNQTGYKNLMRLATAAQLQGFYRKPRIDHAALAEHAKGLIVTTGCLAGEIAYWHKNGREDLAKERFEWYLETFKDDFYAELQGHDIPELISYNKFLIDLANKRGVPLLATNDVHYALEGEAPVHDVMLCVQTKALLSDKDRMRMSGDQYYLKDRSQMVEFAEEAFGNTFLVADKCDVSFKSDVFHLPKFNTPEDKSKDEYLTQLCYDAIENKYSPGNIFWPLGSSVTKEEAIERLDYELSVVAKMEFSAYFLVVWDLIRYAKEQGIWYNVRGSAAGSVIAYLLDLTDIEPITNGLYFERFLNPSRISMPDIDMDFEDSRRGEIVEYSIKKYGKDQVSQIVTFGRMAARSAIKDAGRAMGLTHQETQNLCDMLPAAVNNQLTIAEALQIIDSFKRAYQSNDLIKRVIDTAIALEGSIRSAGTHAAGVVIADKPIIGYAPLQRMTREGLSESSDTVTQFDMTQLERLGLLKMDYLGLKTLSVMRNACDLIKVRHGVSLTQKTIPIHDKEIYQALSRGETIFAFQMESAGMTDLMIKMRPERYENLTAAISLYRPGPMDYIQDYLDGMHGRKKVEYVDPVLKPIMAETWGVCVHENTEIITPNGPIKIKDAIPGDLVLSYNEDAGQPEFRKIKNVFNNGVKEVVSVETKNGSVISTPDHRFFTQSGYIEAKDLRGRLVATYGEFESQSYSEMSEDLLRWVGLFISEGQKNAPKNMEVYEPVISVSKAGNEPVYDIEVEGNHNFYANGVLVHNCTYQEQVMKMAVDFSGFTLPEADTLRKAIGKKDKAALEKQADKFINGAVALGRDKKVAEGLWSDILPFARYSFNKSHAASYGRLAAQTTWLRVKYPLEVFTAYLNSEYGDSDKMNEILIACKKAGIEVLPLDVNKSKYLYTIEGDSIRAGLCSIKTLSDKLSHAIESKAPYADPYEFGQLSGLNEKQMLALRDSGSLVGLFGIGVIECEPQDLLDEIRGGGGFFQDKIWEKKEATPLALYLRQRSLMGIAFTENPNQKTVESSVVSHSLSGLDLLQLDSMYVVSGVLDAVKSLTSKSNQKEFGIISISSGSDQKDFFLFNDCWLDNKASLMPGRIVKIYGRAGRSKTGGIVFSAIRVKYDTEEFDLKALYLTAEAKVDYANVPVRENTEICVVNPILFGVVSQARLMRIMKDLKGDSGGNAEINFFHEGNLILMPGSTDKNSVNKVVDFIVEKYEKESKEDIQ